MRSSRLYGQFSSHKTVDVISGMHFDDFDDETLPLRVNIFGARTHTH